MKRNERRDYFDKFPRRRLTWRILLILQIAGLGMVAMAMPYFIRHLSKNVAPISVDGLLNDRIYSLVGSILFLSLVVLNTLAVIGIWRMYRLTQAYLIIKLSVAIFLILSVFIFAADYYVLFAYIPLLGSLVFMNCAYSRLIARP
ncbi:MAG: hypothetical protein WC734_02750 [Patescibacteria group bacterium]|jgi:hypothetical protein